MAIFHHSRFPDFAATAMLIVLAAVTLISLGALSPIIWTAMKEAVAAQTAQDPRACLVIKDQAERLACFESRVHRDPPPAHGAFAPHSTFGEKDTGLQ